MTLTQHSSPRPAPQPCVAVTVTLLSTYVKIIPKPFLENWLKAIKSRELWLLNTYLQSTILHVILQAIHWMRLISEWFHYTLIVEYIISIKITFTICLTFKTFKTRYCF